MIFDKTLVTNIHPYILNASDVAGLAILAKKILKFGGKSKKLAGLKTPASLAFRMYHHKIGSLGPNRLKISGF